jgi:hypothetical protein
VPHPGHLIRRGELPSQFPTHKHAPAFWESLGRAAATFGFLEDALCKAIFALTATTHYAEDAHQSANVENVDELLSDLRSASALRNVICHGSWAPPDSKGATVPSFVNKKGEVFATPIDKPFLDRLQKSATELACTVIDTVTHMGWQFPGSNGPGATIWHSKSK